MGYEDIIRELENREFLDSLYGFVYKRCNDSHTAEDLCSDIIIKVLSSARKVKAIEHVHAYIWAVAHRVYADFCANRRVNMERMISTELSENMTNLQENPIDEFIEAEEDKRLLKSVLRNIAFLSKIYRDVMVMYYIDELKTAEIAKRLNISETTVKQRLFSARNQIKDVNEKEINNMNSNITLKPINIAYIGSGNVVGNDPRNNAHRKLSKNLIYLCRNQALTAKEISEMMNVPLVYIEEEIEIQVKGENGVYGFLRKFGENKYISNVLIMEVSEVMAGTAAYNKHLDEVCAVLKEVIEANREKILEFPFLSKQIDPRFIIWPLITQIIGRLAGMTQNILNEKYFSDIEKHNRGYGFGGTAIKQGEVYDTKFYGCDGMGYDSYNDIHGYTHVKVSNIYCHGGRIKPHFYCYDHITGDPLLMITIGAIKKGLDINLLTDDYKETAAKAIECGYLRNDNGILTPKIIVLDKKDEFEFYGLLSGVENKFSKIAENIADELYAVINRYVPKHLINEFGTYNILASLDIEYNAIEACIEADLLTVPENPICAEGVVMVVGE